jgi:hypothetical protein
LTEHAPIRCHDDLVDYIRARKEELGLSHEFIEEKCLMTKGHVDKLLGPSKEKGLSRFTVDYFFEILAFELLPRPNPLKEAEMRPRWEGRDETQVRTGGPRRISKTLLELAKPVIYRAFSQLGNEARMRMLPAEHRSAIARKAALARWRRHRKMRRELAAMAAQSRCEERAP